MAMPDGKRLILRIAEGWRDCFFEMFVMHLIKGNTPPNASKVATSRNAQAWKVETEDSSLFVKFFSFRGIRDSIIIRKSRARRAMEGHILLLEKGFCSPAVIAQGELIKGIRIIGNFLITEWIEGLNVYTYIKSFMGQPLDSNALKEKRIFINSFGHLIGQMHRKGIVHGDLRPGNILIKKSGSNPLFYLIDNERNRVFSAGIPHRLREKNLVQLNMILMPEVTFADRMRFLRAYIDKNPELKPHAKDWARKIFSLTKKRLNKKFPGIWEKHYEKCITSN